MGKFNKNYTCKEVENEINFFRKRFSKTESKIGDVVEDMLCKAEPSTRTKWVKFLIEFRIFYVTNYEKLLPEKAKTVYFEYVRHLWTERLERKSFDIFISRHASDPAIATHMKNLFSALFTSERRRLFSSNGADFSVSDIYNNWQTVSPDGQDVLS